MNTYKEHLFGELGNHLYRMKDKDTQNMWGNQNLNIPSTYIKDFFDFYLNELKISPKELIESTDSSNFIEIFYNIQYQRFDERKEWIKTFEESITNNPKIFKQALKTCLNSHGNLLNNSYTETMKNHYLEENKQLFESLVKKGKEAGAFNNINQEDLSTSYSLYKTILEQEGVFKSQFSFAKLIDSLKDEKQKENKFFQTYIIEIIEFLENKPEKMAEIISEQSLLKSFTSEILALKDPANFESQYNFISKLIKTEPEFRKVINDENKKTFCSNFSDLVPTYFNHLNNSEEQRIFNDHLYGFNNSKLGENYGTKATHWLGLFIADEKNSPTKFEIFDLVLKKQKEIGTCVERTQMNEYCSRIQVGFLAKHIEQDELQVQRGLPSKENEIRAYLHEKMNDTSFIINPQNSYASEDISNLQKVYKFIKEKDGESLNFINEKIDLNAQLLLQNIYSNENNYHKPGYVQLLAKTITNFECPEVLKHVIEKNLPWSIEVNKKVKNKSDKTALVSEPFAFTIIESTSPKTFEWFLQSPQLEELAKIKNKTKNIVEHLSTRSDFNDYLNILAESTVGFKKLVLENKKTLKKLSNSENENIKKTTVFIKMEDKLPPKEVKSKPLKI